MVAEVYEGVCTDLPAMKKLPLSSPLAVSKWRRLTFLGAAALFWCTNRVSAALVNWQAFRPQTIDGCGAAILLDCACRCPDALACSGRC